MKIIVTKTAAGTDGVFLAGCVYDVDPAFANQLIASFSAEPLATVEAELAEHEKAQRAAATEAAAPGLPRVKRWI